MPDILTNSVISPDGLTLSGVLACTAVSIILGLGVAYLYMADNTYRKGFVTTLALLPVMVQIVIMLVNGNLGTGVAVMGAFGLVRFRSVPGNAKEICSIFFAMAIGLTTGTGYLLYALIFLIIIGLFQMFLLKSKFGEAKEDFRQLKITIPENLDFDDVFDDVFDAYTNQITLDQIRTTNMGSLYELHYSVQLKAPEQLKEFLDALRCRNGNLNITLGRQVSNKDEL